MARPGIDTVTAAIDAGCCVVLNGPSGSGKTLLLRTIADLDPHSGEVILDGRRCTTMPATEWRRQVCYVPSESQWWADQVGAHFATPPDDILVMLGFDTSVLDWTVSRLSSGERQRLALARALANQPRVLLLDEPTANLDPDNTARVETLIANYLQQQDVAVLWVSHDPDQAERVADRRWSIKQGTLRLDEEDVAA